MTRSFRLILAFTVLLAACDKAPSSETCLDPPLNHWSIQSSPEVLDTRISPESCGEDIELKVQNASGGGVRMSHRLNLAQRTHVTLSLDLMSSCGTTGTLFAVHLASSMDRNAREFDAVVDPGLSEAAISVYDVDPCSLVLRPHLDLAALP